MNEIRKRLSELSSTQVEEITSFLKSHFCTIFHEPDFNRIVSEIFETEFSYSLLYNSCGKLIALCPLHSVKDGLLTKTYSNPAMYDVRYGGWVYDRDETSLPELIDQLDLSFIESLTYWSAPQIETNDYVLIKSKKEFQTGVIDLSLSLDDILYKCVSRKRREAISSASRKGVIVEELNSSNLNIFIKQCNFIKRSIGGRGFPDNYFISLFDSYYNKKKIIVLASKLNHDYLATGMIIGNKKITHLWMAGKPEGIQANVPRQDLLIWNAIKWAKEIGSKYFDLCVIESDRLPKIAKYKLGFSKKIVPFYLYTKKSLCYRMVSRAKRMFRKKNSEYGISRNNR